MGGGIGNPFATIISGFNIRGRTAGLFLRRVLLGTDLQQYLLWKNGLRRRQWAFALVADPVSVRLQSIPRYLQGNVVFMLGFTDLGCIMEQKMDYSPHRAIFGTVGIWMPVPLVPGIYFPVVQGKHLKNILAQVFYRLRLSI